LNVLRQISHRHFFFAALHLLIWSILFSKAGISISIVILIFLSIIRIKSVNPLKLYLNKAFFSIKTYQAKHWGLYGLVGFFVLTCLSGLNSENTQQWIHFLNIKSPYILIPIVFCNHPNVLTKNYHQLYISLITVVCLSSLFVLGYYFIDYAHVTDSLGFGKSLWTPLSHVKFSILLALSAIASFILSQRIQHRQTVLRCIGIFLILSLHILAVRSGLVVLYFVGGLLLLYHLWNEQQTKQFLLVILLLILGPITAYFTIPSVYHKVHYVKHDLKMIQQGQTANYSDGERVRSLQIGVDIIKKNPFFGTGIGDIRDVSDQYYSDWFPDSQKKILPHNQYVLAWASLGIIGLIFFTVCLLSPLIGLHFNDQTLLYSLIFSLLVYGLVEKPMDEYVFVSVHALFVCAGLSHFARIKEQNNMIP